MHQPNSDSKIETIIDGERVCGTAHYTGSGDITVRLEEPSTECSTGVHMPYFARGVHPDGFLRRLWRAKGIGASELVVQGAQTRRPKAQFAGVDFEEFDRIRYLAVNPGHPAHGRNIREQAKIDSTIYIQIEEDGPYGLARFFDSGTNQPFLSEAAVYDDNIQKYVEGVKADLGFSHHLETVRRKLVPDTQRNAERLSAYKLSPRQVKFLGDFGQFWRAGEIPLDAGELDQLINLGYVIRDNGRCANEIASLGAAIDRSRTAQERLEAEGKHEQAAQCVAKIRRIQQRIEMKALMITPTGKAVAQDFPGDLEE